MIAMRRLSLRVTFALLAVVTAWACGGTTGTSVPEVDAGSTSGSSGTSGIGEPVDDAGPVVDPPVDSGPGPKPEGEVEIELVIDALTQSCQPVVPQDPVTVQGRITIRNKSNVALSALKFAKGNFLGTGGQVIAGFATDTTTQAIQPNGTRDFLFEKTSKSMSPAAGCATVACNREIIVELAYTGSRSGTVRAKPIEMSCSF